MSADPLNVPGPPGQIISSDAQIAGATLEQRAQALNEAFGAADVAARLTGAAAAAHGRLVFTTSFGLEDQVLTHFIVDAGLPVEIVTLDTDRLFPEVRALWKETEAHF